MERKRVFEKENKVLVNHKGYTSLLYTRLSNSYLQGDNLKWKRHDLNSSHEKQTTLKSTLTKSHEVTS